MRNKGTSGISNLEFKFLLLHHKDPTKGVHNLSSSKDNAENYTELKTQNQLK